MFLSKKVVFGGSCALIFALAYFSDPVNAQVTMQDAFEPFRADKVAVDYDEAHEAGAFVFLDVVVTGRNENGDGVGYRSEEVVTPEEWLDALNAYLALPDPGAVGDLVSDAGFTNDGGIWTHKGIEWGEYDTSAPGLCYVGGVFYYGKTVSACVGRLMRFQPDAELREPGEECSPTPGKMVADFADEENNTVLLWESDDEVVDICAYGVPEVVDVLLGPDAALQFLPSTEFSEEPLWGDAVPIGPERPFNQRERSSIAQQLEIFDLVSDYATGYYESDAYDGYPGFELYFGFFAFDGAPDDPEDEGDCPEGFCEGGGGPGGGGGTADDFEGGLTQFCENNPTVSMCLNADDIEEFTEEEVRGEFITEEGGEGWIEGFMEEAEVDGGGSGECPEPPTFEIPEFFGGGDYSFDNTLACAALEDMVAPLLLMASWVWAGLLIVRA